MAKPKIFVSSTCYDLKYIRENIKYFINTIGYEPILSEEGSIYYNPEVSVQDACVAEIPNCQMLILIIGGRFGSRYKDTDQSVTNTEYRQAIDLKIPIFALVDQNVYNDYRLYRENLENKAIDFTKIKYPSVDNCKIFDFITEVSGYAFNNALFPFSDFLDIESYLKSQWAGMMYYYLTRANESIRMMSTLDTLEKMNERIEEISKRILSSVGSDIDKIDLEVYDKYIKSTFVKRYPAYNTTPFDIILNKNLTKFNESNGIKVNVDKENGRVEIDGSRHSLGCRIEMYENFESEYNELRGILITIIRKGGMTERDYIKNKREKINQ